MTRITHDFRYLQENKEKLEAAERELEETRLRHKTSVMELVAGTRQTLGELEAELEVVGSTGSASLAVALYSSIHL